MLNWAGGSKKLWFNFTYSFDKLDHFKGEKKNV
jgi:hypothetical protein